MEIPSNILIRKKSNGNPMVKLFCNFQNDKQKVIKIKILQSVFFTFLPEDYFSILHYILHHLTKSFYQDQSVFRCPNCH